MKILEKITIKTIQLFRALRSGLLVSQLGFISRCKYEETCGDYLIRQIKEVGIFKGLLFGIKRIGSCQGVI